MALSDRNKVNDVTHDAPNTMVAAITDAQRGIDNRGVAPAWATEPPLWGEPVPGERLRTMLQEMERNKVFQFARPDGSSYETTWTNSTSARAWADTVGHRYLGEVPSRTPTPPTPRATENRGTEDSLSPPPLIPAPPPPPPPHPPPPPPPHPPPPRHVERQRPAPLPPPTPDEYTIIDYFREDFVDTTMKESMPLISKLFGRVGEVLQAVPGLQGVGKAYEDIGEIAEGLNLLYELIHEIPKAQALDKGAKEVVKRIKPVKRIAESLLKKKYPDLPEPARKKAVEILEDLFEKYVSDPAIEKGRKEMQEMDEGKELNKPLWKELKNLLGTSPTPNPAPLPAR